MPIEVHPISNAVSNGITLGATFPGILPPEYEVREAARFGHYNWEQWEDLGSEEQAGVIAHYRLNKLIDLHSNDAMTRHMRRIQEEAARRRGNR